MPSSSKWNTDGAKSSTSTPFPVKLGEQTKSYTLKTEANIVKERVSASKLTLQDEVQQGNTKTPRALATSLDGGKTWTLEKDSEGKSILDSTQIAALYPGNKLYAAVRNVAKIDAQSNGASPAQQNDLTNGNAAATPGTGDSITNEDRNFFEKERKSIKSRDDYGTNKPIVYPEGLSLDYQDCIKFSIVKYQQSGLKGFGPGNQDLRRVTVNAERKILGTIVLPIPGGISDSNRVNWSGMDLPDLQGALAGLMKTGIMGEDMAKDFEKQAKEISTPGSGARTAIVSKLIESAIGQGGIMQREFGAIINPNLELLFNSPDLRQFSFSFRLSPRSSKEAEIVKKIIRSFKQSMSVKRSNSSFLLQTPHTFAISYIFKNKDHPYLNRFKECALTSCNVNYTPEGTYMSFDDSNNPSMVSYQLDLTFQELEPIYDDDYTDLDENKDTKIGY
jgi:hypothetical protein